MTSKMTISLQIGYFADLLAGREYSYVHSPYSVKQAFNVLLAAKLAERFTAIDGKENDMIRVSEHGKQMRGMK